MDTRTANRAARKPSLLWRRLSGRTANPWRVVAALLVTGGIFYGLQFAMGWILGGIAYLVWFVDALPQTLVWFGLLAVLLALTLRLGREKPRKPKDTAGPLPSEPAQSDLAYIARCIRQAESSLHARDELKRRLSQTAVALRVKREAIAQRQAWDAVTEGRWPAHPDLQTVLHPERGRARLVPRRGYVEQLDRAVGALESYARGGNIDGS